ncbi:MAG: glycosyltransferase, partial [Clostridia bacterium]|nr:glycosyltransferase [Clostridia bacterium]
LKNRGVSFLWLLIGDGAQREQIERLTREKKVADKIYITGFLKNPFPYMNACDIYVQPSYEDSQPLALLEAQILGKPLVSTETVGGKTILENGKKGVLTPFTAAGLADGICSLLSDAERRASLANLFRPEDETRNKQAYVAGWEALLSE